MTSDHWALNGLVLIGLLIALYFNLSWPWGILFMFWAVPSLLSGEAQLVGSIQRGETPVLYWAVVLLWILTGIMMLMVDLAPAQLDAFYARIWGM